MDSLEKYLFIASGFTIFSVFASKASSRFGIPALLLFLLIGIAGGAHGAGGLSFTNYKIAQELGVLALIFILFSGGMDTRLKSIRSVLKPALMLSTVGVVIAALIVGIFAHYALGFSIFEGVLLGAIVASTDVAAVFTVLRSNRVGLKGKISSLLELESALNDPMTVFLSIGFLTLIERPDRSAFRLLPLFFQQMVLGGVIGWASGRAAASIINRIKLEFEGLYPVFGIGWILLTYAVTQVLGGSGFLAVYVAGILLGNKNLLHKKSLVHFQEGVAWLMQIAMFLTMGLLIDPKELWAIAPVGIALSIFLVFVARPVSVFLCLWGSKFTSQDKLMVSWAGLRGAAPIILATYPLLHGTPRAMSIFNLVFFVTFTSVLLQGTLIPFVAKWLKVDLPFKEKFRFPIEFNPTKDLKNNLVEITVPPRARVIGKSLVQLMLPQDVLVVLIQRDGDILVPRGGTQITAKDTLLMLAGTKTPEEITEMLFGDAFPERRAFLQL